MSALDVLERDEACAAARARVAPVAALYPFAPHFVTHERRGEAGRRARRVRQHYVDEGPRDAEPLLFVHGNPTWSFAWRRAIGHLRGRYRCVALDHVGCGLSDKPGDYAYRLTRHIENLERLVLELDLRAITLVVHDWGGPIGLGLARRHPARIARLVITNTAASPADRIPLRIAACRLPVFGQLAVRGLNAFARGATRMAVERPLAPDVRRGYLLPYDSWRNRVATLAFVYDIPESPAHPSHAELEAIRASLDGLRDRPTLVLWGERDWCFTPRYRERWQACFPDARVRRFEDAGHYLFEDAADEVVAELDAFLARHPLAR